MLLNILRGIDFKVLYLAIILRGSEKGKYDENRII